MLQDPWSISIGEKSQSVAVVCCEAQPYSSWTRTIQMNNYGKYCSNFSVIGWCMRWS